MLNGLLLRDVTCAMMQSPLWEQERDESEPVKAVAPWLLTDDVSVVKQ